MSDSTQNLDLAVRAARTGQAVADLAKDDTVFRAAVDAFRAGDGDSFLLLLDRVKARPYCEEICRWFASKETVLECLELCGPPIELTAQLVAAAAVEIVRISADEELVESLADIVERRDAKAFKAFVQKQKLQAYCRLICHWACAIRFGLICEVVCITGEPPEKSLAAQLSLAGKAIAPLVENRDQLQGVIDAAIAQNCEYLQGVIGVFNDCHLVCRWICSWRSIYVCGPVCRPIEVPKDYIEEMRAFAQVSGKLTGVQNAYPQLFAAVEARDAKAFSTLVQQYEVEPYCLQLCHWISYEVCNRFCICVCPQPETIPLFTKVGQYHVDPIFGDFQPNGTTTAGGYAFSTTINLNGILPDGTAPDPLQYQFTSQIYGLVGSPPVLTLIGTPSAITGAMIPPSTIIGQLEYYYWDTTLSAWLVGSTDFYVNNPSATVSIPQEFGPPLTVVVDTDPDSNGWINVPRQNDLTPGGVGRFVPTGLLAQLDTTQLTNEFFDLTLAGPGLPVLAGAPVPSAQLSVKPLYQIVFSARNATTLASVGSNTLNIIALSNTNYKYTRHPDWAGSTPTTPPVVSLDILEMQAGGCTPLGMNSNTLHALFTVYHPYLGSASLEFVGPAPLPPTTTFTTPADGDVTSGAAGLAIDISMLVPCAYVVFLNANLNLTNGDVVLYGTFQDFVAFCRR
ncbi:MAG TPA: hypothetical protein VHT28_16120 [Silvibacterium sp.]|nr:hypothetical protein [Silvibacterium sp.]